MRSTQHKKVPSVVLPPDRQHWQWYILTSSYTFGGAIMNDLPISFISSFTTTTVISS
jgi:hypothetical protein